MHAVVFTVLALKMAFSEAKKGYPHLWYHRWYQSWKQGKRMQL